MAISDKQKLVVQQRVWSDMADRIGLSKRMGFQYDGDRKVYEALGYPDDQNLTFQYYYKRYIRQDIAAAVINKPVDSVWKGEINVLEKDTERSVSKLNEAWEALNEDFKVKDTLTKLDKLTGIGKYGILLFGLDDVKNRDDWKLPVAGTRTLKYIRPVGENDITIEAFEKKSANPRFGLPKFYKIQTSSAELDGAGTYDIVVHWTRVLHIVDGNLSGQIVGMPRLKPIINRLNDLEKLLGGSAEMFWRGARPGYNANVPEEFDMTPDEEDDLDDELKAYENDLRRIIVTKGIDMKPLAMQVADPSNHIDVQIQAISAHTGIPKRILTGSERGELASSQDRDAWLELVKTRREEFAEPKILRPFIDYCMEYGILPKSEKYNVHWEDLFALSEDDRVKIGKMRADAIAAYANSTFAQELFPPKLIVGYILGLKDDELEEFIKTMEKEQKEMIVIGDGPDDEEPEIKPTEP